MTLQFHDPTTDQAPTANVLLYGPAGTGKSVAAFSIGGTVLALNCEGPSAWLQARALNPDTVVQEVRLTKENAKDTLEEFYLHARSHTDELSAVIVDSLGELHKALLNELGSGAPSLQQHGEVNTRIERFVRSLRDLPVDVVLLAHEQIDDSEGEIVRRPLTGGKKLPEAVLAMVDIAAYTGIVEETDDSPRRFVGQVVAANGRRAKDRSQALGKAPDLDLKTWLATYRKAMAPAPPAAADKPKKKTTAKPKEAAAA